MGRLALDRLEMLDIDPASHALIIRQQQKTRTTLQRLAGMPGKCSLCSSLYSQGETAKDYRAAGEINYQRKIIKVAEIIVDFVQHGYSLNQFKDKKYFHLLTWENPNVTPFARIRILIKNNRYAHRHSRYKILTYS